MGTIRKIIPDFFKVIKPYMLGEYFLYSKLFEIEASQTTITSINAKKIKGMISEASLFFDENQEFYRYYWSKAEHLNDKYFVRPE